VNQSDVPTIQVELSVEAGHVGELSARIFGHVLVRDAIRPEVDQRKTPHRDPPEEVELCGCVFVSCGCRSFGRSLSPHKDEGAARGNSGTTVMKTKPRN